MDNHKFKDYIYWGVTAFCVIAASIFFGYLLINIQQVKAAGSMLMTILMPIIYGAVLAYLLAPIYNWCIKIVTKLFSDKRLEKLESKKEGLARTAGTLVSLFVLFSVIVGLFSMLIPELKDSIQNVVEALPTNMNNLAVWVENKLNDNSQMRELAITYMNEAVQWGKNFGKEVLAPNLDKIISGLSSGMYSIIVWVKNLLIGLIVMIYLLNMKDNLAAIAKKCIYAILPFAWAERFIDEVRETNKVFGGFIIGKLLDSLIIGVICFLCMSLMKMPYVLLVSVIIGVTNIIPFFGPFIGAVPSAILVLLVSPVQCLYFLIFILLLQQFDGNILGPKILGEFTKISSFWVLFSILLFGGVFGFVGMIIGVPTFAVIYRLVGEAITASLHKRHLPEQTDCYLGGDPIEEKDELRKEEDKLSKGKRQEKRGKVN